MGRLASSKGVEVGEHISDLLVVIGVIIGRHVFTPCEDALSQFVIAVDVHGLDEVEIMGASSAIFTVTPLTIRRIEHGARPSITL